MLDMLSAGAGTGNRQQEHHPLKIRSGLGSAPYIPPSVPPSVHPVAIRPCVYPPIPDTKSPTHWARLACCCCFCCCRCCSYCCCCCPGGVACGSSLIALLFLCTTCPSCQQVDGSTSRYGNCCCCNLQKPKNNIKYCDDGNR